MQRNILRKGDHGAIKHAGDNAGQFGSPVSPVAPGGVSALAFGPGYPANPAQAGFWARNPSLDPEAVSYVAERMSQIYGTFIPAHLSSFTMLTNLDEPELWDIHRSFLRAPKQLNSYQPGIRPEVQDAFESTGMENANVVAEENPEHYRVELPGSITVSTRFNTQGEMSVKAGEQWMHPGAAWSQQELWDEVVAEEVDTQATTNGFTDAPSTGLLSGSLDRHTGNAHFVWEDNGNWVGFGVNAQGTVDFGSASMVDRRALVNAFTKHPGELSDVIPTIERLKTQAAAARSLMVNHPATHASRRRHQG